MDRMQRTQEEMAAHIRNLENNYQNVLNEMVNFQRNMAQQDGLMQNLIQYFLQLENGDYSPLRNLCTRNPYPYPCPYPCSFLPIVIMSNISSTVMFHVELSLTPS